MSAIVPPPSLRPRSAPPHCPLPPNVMFLPVPSEAPSVRRRAFAASLLALIAPACGSGLFGAGAAAASSDDDPPPPAVSGRFPAPGGVETPSETEVILSFTKPIASGFDPAGLLTVEFDGTPVEGTLTAAGSQIEFAPTRALALERVHEVRWQGSVDFESGETLDVNEAWSFTVRGGSWGGADLVVTFSQILDYELSSDGRGAAMSSGELIPPGSGSVPVSSLFTSVQEPDGSWQVPISLAFGDQSITRPSVTWSADATRLYAVWIETDAMSSDATIKTARLEPDGVGVWEALGDVPTTMGSTLNFPTLVAAPNGAVDCIYQSGSSVRRSRLSSGGNWGVPTQMSTGNVFRPAVRYAPDGTAYAYWISNAAGTLQYARANASGAWGAMQSLTVAGVAFDTSFTFPPQLTLGEDGGGVVAFREASPSFFRHGAARLAPGGGVGAVQYLDDGLFNEFEFTYVDTAYIEDGEFLIAFVGAETSMSPQSVYAITWNPSTSSTPSARTTISDESTAPPNSSRRYLQVEVAARSPYGANVTWLQGNFVNMAASARLQTRRFDPARGWSEIETISDGIFGCPSFPGDAPLSDRGTSAVVWTELSDCSFSSGKGGPPNSALYGLSAVFD